MISKSVPTFEHERLLWREGYQYVVGMDEVGRGSFAGPVVVGAVIFPYFFNKNVRCCFLDGVNDSKKLSSKKRAKLVKVIYAHALDWAIGTVPAEYIDERGITESVRLATIIAWKCLSVKPDFGLFDGGLVTRASPQKVQHIVKGDSISISIACASIIAKEWRDAYMKRLSRLREHQVYRWDENAGYGTNLHRLVIKVYGPTTYHRKSFIHDL